MPIVTFLTFMEKFIEKVSITLKNLKKSDNLHKQKRRSRMHAARMRNGHPSAKRKKSRDIFLFFWYNGKRSEKKVRRIACQTILSSAFRG